MASPDALVKEKEMTVEVKALVLSGNGINCERETAHACRLAGADEVVVTPIWDLIAGEVSLSDFHLLCLPGGFADGDDLGSALATANRIRYSRVGGSDGTVLEELRGFVERGNLVIGICNGFQLLVKLGLLPFVDATPRVTLTVNESGRFEDRWVSLSTDPASPCVFTRGLDRIELPVRHGEGRLVLDQRSTGDEILRAHMIPLRYADPETGHPTETYPDNPNGSFGQAAALCDRSGRVFGLMPHPEAFLHRTNHPRWTREPISEVGKGAALFRNAVDHLRTWLEPL